MIRKKILLAAGLLAGPLFVTTFLIEGFARPGYSLVRDPISSLSLGPFGWVQVINFWITGLLLLLFACGLRMTLKNSPIKSFLGPFLLGLSALSFIGAGTFTTDPVYGYPTNLPWHLLPQTTHGHLHSLFSLFGVVVLPAASFVFARYFLRTQKRSWAIYSLLSGTGMLVFFILAISSTLVSMHSADPTTGLAGIGGLLQRAADLIILVWVTLLAAHTLKITGPQSNR
jgi:hypothetical protein